MRRLTIALSLAAVLAAACRESSNAVEANTDEVTAERNADGAEPREITITNFFTFAVAGSGDIAFGAQCAPGGESYEVNLESGLAHRSVCVVSDEEPLPRPRAEIAEFKAEALATLKQAVADLKPSRGQRCAGDRPFVAISNGTDTFSSPELACEGDVLSYAEGLGGVLAALAAGTWAEAEPTADETLAAPGDSVLVEGIDQIVLEQVGSGEMKIGSSCLPNAVTYTLRQGEPLQVRRCESRPSGQWRETTKSFTLGEADLEGIFATVDSAKRVDAKTCAENPDAALRRLVLSGAEGARDVFLDEAYACLTDASNAPAAGLQGLAEAMEAAIAKAPAETPDAGTDAAKPDEPTPTPDPKPTPGADDAGKPKPKPNPVNPREDDEASDDDDELEETPTTTSKKPGAPKAMTATASCAAGGGPAGSSALGLVFGALALASRRRRKK